jgi:hypothetical protein
VRLHNENVHENASDATKEIEAPPPLHHQEHNPPHYDHTIENSDDHHSANVNERTAPPMRMSVDSTPDFMHLPLEYQGYCPWTIAQRSGLLLPGDPSLGT